MYADRIKSLPPYLFAAIDKAKQEAREKGVDIIDLGVGDPDIRTPQAIIDALCQAGNKDENHRYPSYEGKPAFRKAVAQWYWDTFGVKLDPTSEVLGLIGSKEGIAHAPLAFINPGDLALVPDPAYPVYRTSVQFAHGTPVVMPLLKENEFLPDLQFISPDTARKSKIMFLNYPNNPTGAVASQAFFKEVVDFARDYRILVFHDNPYSEIFFGTNRSPSILEFPGAREVAVEFNSLSKTCSMAGWRVGFVVGNANVIAGLGKIKTNIDSGIFGAVQDAAIVALESDPSQVEKLRNVYHHRMQVLYQALVDIGLEISIPRATFYLWARVGGDSMAFVRELLQRTGIVATPGIGFGEYGRDYVRFSVTQDTALIEMAAKRLRDFAGSS